MKGSEVSEFVVNLLIKFCDGVNELVERLPDFNLELNGFVIGRKFSIIGFEERCLIDLLLDRKKLFVEKIQVMDLVLNGFILFLECW